MVCKGAKAELLNDEQKFIFGASDCQFLPRLAHLFRVCEIQGGQDGAHNNPEFIAWLVSQQLCLRTSSNFH
jgi:hypothetical protein